MPKNYTKEKQKNIDALVKIRDDADTQPVVRVQAVRTMQKLLNEDHPQTSKNLKTLIGIRDDETIKSSIRVMAMQTLNSMFDVLSDTEDDKTSAGDIMNRIRSGKK